MNEMNIFLPSNRGKSGSKASRGISLAAQNLNATRVMCANKSNPLRDCIDRERGAHDAQNTIPGDGFMERGRDAHRDDAVSRLRDVSARRAA